MAYLLLPYILSTQGEKGRKREWGTEQIFQMVNYTNYKHSKTSFEKNCFSAWVSTLNMGLINKVDMVCLSP